MMGRPMEGKLFRREGIESNAFYRVPAWMSAANAKGSPR